MSPPPDIYIYIYIYIHIHTCVCAYTHICGTYLYIMQTVLRSAASTAEVRFLCSRAGQQRGLRVPGSRGTRFSGLEFGSSGILAIFGCLFVEAAPRLHLKRTLRGEVTGFEAVESCHKKPQSSASLAHRPNPAALAASGCLGGSDRAFPSRPCAIVGVERPS